MHASTVMRHIHSILCSLLELTNVLFIIKLKELDALEETLLRYEKVQNKSLEWHEESSGF